MRRDESLPRPGAKSEHGVALLLALIAVAVLAALGVSLILVTDTDMRVSGNYAGSREALYAAEGALEIAAHELLAVSDWNALLAGGVLSGFVDGAPVGNRPLRDGTMVSLVGVTQAAINEPRPWGLNNLYWRLFAFGGLGPGAYVIAWVGDDPGENDDNPLGDGGGASNPGAGVLMLRAEAFGTQGTHKVLEAIVRRVVGAGGEPAIQVLSWTEIR